MKPEDQKNYWEEKPAEEPVQEEAPDQTPEVAPAAADTPVTWTAEEYVHLDKGPSWFIIFFALVLGVVALDVLLLHTWTISVLAVVIAVALMVYIRRPPRTLTYGLSGKQGLYVGEKQYHFEEFKAFGLIKDGEHQSIMLIPTKRFAAGVSVYFPQEAGEQIVDILGQRLPMENLKLDVIDVVVRKLRL